MGVCVFVSVSSACRLSLLSVCHWIEFMWRSINFLSSWETMAITIWIRFRFHFNLANWNQIKPLLNGNFCHVPCLLRDTEEERERDRRNGIQMKFSILRYQYEINKVATSRDKMSKPLKRIAGSAGFGWLGTSLMPILMNICLFCFVIVCINSTFNNGNDDPAIAATRKEAN